jgi:hypothetical protein
MGETPFWKGSPLSCRAIHPSEGLMIELGEKKDGELIRKHTSKW